MAKAGVFVNVVGQADVGQLRAASAALQQMATDADGAGRTLSSKFQEAGASVQRFGAGMARAGQRVTVGLSLPIVAAGAAAVKAFTEAEEVAAQTAAVLESTGHAAGITAKDIDGLASSISAYSGIDDEAIASGENLLLTFTNIRNEVGAGNDVFNQATAIMADMSTALGQDMKSSAIQLGKALNDPIKGVTALSRVGVSFTEQQKTQIKTLVDSGRAMDAQKIILAELTKEFGGSARAAGETTAGQFNKLKVSIGNLGESFGAILIPFVQQAGTVLQGLVGWMQGLSPPTQAFAVKIALVVAALGPLLTIFGRLTEVTGLVIRGIGLLIPLFTAEAAAAGTAATATTAAGTAVGAAAAPILVVVAAVAAIAAAFVIAYQKSEAFRNVVDGVVSWLTDTVGPAIQEVAAFVIAVWQDIQAWTEQVWPMIQQIISTVANTIQAVIEAFISVVSAAWNLFGDNIVSAIRTAWNLIKSVVQAAINVVQGIIQTVLAIITGKWGEAWNGIKQVLAGVWDAIKGVVRAAIDIVKNIIGTVLEAIAALWRNVWAGIKSVASNIWNGIKDVVGDAIRGVKNVIGSVLDAIETAWRATWGTMKSVVTGTWDAIVAGVKVGLNGLIRLLNVAVMSINVLIRGYNAIPFAPNIPTIPHIPELAKGGTVLQAGLALVGERGPELLSLPRGASVTPLRGNSGAGGGAPVINVHFHGSVGAGADRDVTAALDGFARELARQLRTA